MQTLVVAPNMSDLNAAGGGSDDYSKLPKGNIDVTGEYFVWTANGGTSGGRQLVVTLADKPVLTASDIEVGL